MALACSKCQTELPAEAKFCLACGHPVIAETSAPPKYASPDQYIPKHLAEKILAARTSLEGERKQVTVLFADVKGSTELIADEDPEAADRLLNPVLDQMMGAVHRYEGTVTRVTGDGIMALFGAPLAHEDHAIRACYAAKAMQEAIQRDAEEEDPGKSEAGLQIRVGLNSGEVVVRSIANDLFMEYTAMGKTAHLAARMEQVALPGRIVLSADTLKLAGDSVRVKALGLVSVKGIRNPVEAYELLDVNTVGLQMEAIAARGLSRFVGRDVEFEAMRKAIEKADSGDGQIVALVGEPGVGKSRLFREFIHSQGTRDWQLLESVPASFGRITPFLPVVDLLRACFRIESRDDPQDIRKKVMDKMAAMHAVEPGLPALLSLLDVSSEDENWRALDPPRRRRKTLDALKRLFLRESQNRLLCLAMEDLHWIDTETQAFLDDLVESLPKARILLFVDYRPEYQHGWGGKTYYTQLRIDPLTPENAEQLLLAILGDDPEHDPLKRLLIAQTEGNPFFMEECIQTLVETGVLVGERGAYRAVKPLSSIEVPATVQAVIAARIDRLPADEKRLLQAAAVIGKDIPLALLQAISRKSEETLKEGLAALKAAEFLYEAPVFPEVEYTFKHGLTYQVAYGSLLRDRRQKLHARIVDAIERFSPDRVLENAEQLGYHALRGELWEKAVSYFRQASIKLVSRSAHREAIKFYEQALLALPHLPQTRENQELAIDIRFELRSSLWAVGEFGRIIAHLGDAERLAVTLDDPRRRGWVSTYMSASLWQLGQPTEAQILARNAQAIAEELQDFQLDAAANFYLGCAHVTSDDYRKSEACFQKIVDTLVGDRSRDRCGLPFLPAVVARSWLVWALAERGEFDQGISQGEATVRFAESLAQPFSRAHIYYDLGYLYSIKGDFDAAIGLLDSAFNLIRRWDLTYLSPFITGFLGHAYALSGRVAEGVSLLEQAQTAYETMGMGLFRSLVGAQYGEALVLANKLDDAQSTTEGSLTLARSRCERGHEAYALRILGEIAAQRDPPDTEAAFGHYREALALAETLEMRPLIGHCHLGLGRLHRCIGEQGEAERHIGDAVSMYRDLDMSFWAEQAKAHAEAMG
jgi:class 3 adenylate cyclase/tetratricopeptide (TPR) repeat protein